MFKVNLTGGDIRLKGHSRGVTRALRGPDFPPITMQYVYMLLNVKFCLLQASDVAPLSIKSNQSNQTDNFIVRLKVDQRAGQHSLPHLGITKTEKN